MTRQQKIHIDSFVRPLHFVPETQKISDVLRLFQKYHVQLAIVTSEYGTTVGLVTLEDIVEELV
jgi:CBS domain containing-hemolysin-like protein